MQILNNILLTFACCCSLWLMGCKEESANQLNIDVETQALTDQNVADSELDDVASMSTEIMSLISQSLSRGTDTTLSYDNCASLVYAAAEKKITVDFSSTGCTGRDGRIRKGKLIFTFTGPLVSAGTVVYTAFDNYEIKRNGSQVFVRVDNNSTFRQETIEMMRGGSFRFTRTMNARLNFADGSAFTWQGARKIIWDNSDVGNRFDDTWTTDTTSTSSGTTRRGIPFTVKFKKRIVSTGLCMSQGISKPVSGKLDMLSSNITRSIDFGEGTCSQQANVVVNGVQKTISLP